MKHLLVVVALGLSLISLNSFATPSYKVTVNGMVCSFCAQGIEKKMKVLLETKGVYVELKNHLVLVEAKLIKLVKDNPKLTTNKKCFI